MLKRLTVCFALLLTTSFPSNILILTILGEQEDTAGVEFNEASGEAKNGEDGLQEEEIEETPAVKELKAIITTALNEQVQQLKTTVEQQIKTKDEEIAKKMGLSPNDVGGPPKSPRGKGKRGK